MNTKIKRTNPVLIALFWAYTIIPLAWGVSETMRKAMALFQ